MKEFLLRIFKQSVGKQSFSSECDEMFDKLNQNPKVFSKTFQWIVYKIIDHKAKNKTT